MATFNYFVWNFDTKEEILNVPCDAKTSILDSTWKWMVTDQDNINFLDCYQPFEDKLEELK